MTTKYLQLLDRLIQKTDAGELAWEETAAGDAFQVSFPNYAVILSEAETPTTIDYVVELVNADGRIIDRFSDVTLERTDPSSQRGGPRHFDRMKALFEVARRQALGVDKALDEILRELDNEKF
ncbi:MAG: hypothetical protein ACM3JG_13420 [Thiohalocapsa sp.]